jgi:hypothetical protein
VLEKQVPARSSGEQFSAAARKRQAFGSFVRAADLRSACDWARNRVWIEGSGETKVFPRLKARISLSLGAARAERREAVVAPGGSRRARKALNIIKIFRVIERSKNQ